MRQITPYALWLGHAGDDRDVRRVLETGLGAVVDLAVEEPPMSLTHELVYCRFPIVDGPGNPPWLLRAAIETVAALLRSNVPTLACCGAGMSRAPAVAAAALATVEGRPAEDFLEAIQHTGACDVSPGLWLDVRKVLT